MTFREFITPFSVFTEIVIYSVKYAKHYYVGEIKDIPVSLLEKISNSDILNVRIRAGQLHIDILEYN